MGARRRSGGGLLAGVVLLALVAGILVGADVVVRRVVEHRVARAVAQRVGGSPVVHVSGPSALVQLATDRWDAITVRDDDARVTHQGRQVPARLDGRVSGASGLVRGTRVVLGAVDGTADVDWAAAGRLAGTSLSGDDQGRVTASDTISLFGAKVPVEVTGRPTVDVPQQRIVLDAPQVSVDGARVDDATVAEIMPSIQDRLRLPSIDPLQVTGLQASRAGARVTVHGVDVPLARG